MSERGVLFASIDDNEVSAFKQVLTETFGEQNRLGTIIWKNATDNNPTNIAVEHEYIHVFANSRDGVPPEWKSLSSDVKNRLLKEEAELIGTGRRRRCREGAVCQVVSATQAAARAPSRV